ncbi:MAG: cobalamin B12-binding domain-containing protein [Armatimonadetes bacterium]|nr:cobalamin B12-binding domain-containing protein [Armatimonadota bacterium]
MRAGLKSVKPYGDTMGDGAVQLSFTLPLDDVDQAREGGRLLALKMGLENPRVVFAKRLGREFVFLVVYGASKHSLDVSSLQVSKLDVVLMSHEEIREFVRSRIGRKIRVMGACLGTDAHTVGIDAVLSMKGYAGHKGLESYPDFEVSNLGAQVAPADLVEKARQSCPDALLISQVVTQKDIHRATLSRFLDYLDASGERSKYVLIAGGPGLTHPLAKELGYDAGFGAGTVPEQVASYIVQELARRKGK